MLKELTFFIPIIYFTHFGAFIKCLEFYKNRTSRTEDMGMCTIAQNGNTRDKSGRFYKVIIIALDNAPYKMLHKLKSALLYQKKPTLNKCVFKCFTKVAGLTVRSLNSTGNSFQQLGPATAKALEPQSVLWLGTTRSPFKQRIWKADLTRDCRLYPWCKKQQVSRSETFKTLEH